MVNQTQCLEQKAKELFQLAKAVSNKGNPVLFGNHYQGTLDGVRHRVDLAMHLGSDSVSVSTDDWGINFSDHIGPCGNRRYMPYVWKGDIPNNIIGILKKLKKVPNEEPYS